MPDAKQPMLRRGLRRMLEWLDRFKGADFLLFVAAMMLKLYLFDRLIHVAYMDMNGADALVALGTLGLIGFWTLWLPTRGRIAALIVLDFVLTFVVYADLIYYRYFQDLISIPVLLQAGQVESLGGSISTLMIAKDALLMADWPFLLAFGIYLALKGRRDLPVRRAGSRGRKAAVRLTASLLVFAAGGALVFSQVHEARSTWAKGLFEQSYWNLSLYNVTGVLGFHGYDAYRYAKQNWLSGARVSDAETEAVYDWMRERGARRAELEQDGLFGAYRGSNVIVVQAEAFQNFVIGKKIGGQEVTPTINKLMKESAYFSQFYHQTAQGRTSDADFAANCSLQPVTNGSVFIQYAQHTYDCTPSVLGASGYATAAFHAYDGGFWNRNSMYANMGYDRFYSKKNFKLDEKVGWSVGDKSFFRQSVDLMAQSESPFYSFLITLSSHHPYAMPEKEKKLDTGELEGTIMGDYLQAVRYVDSSLGALVDRLKEKGLWDKTILVFYGDHDNSIKEWELFETFLGRKLNKLDRETLLKQVPLLVRLPDGAQAGTRTNIGGQLDIEPTLLHLLGIPSSGKALLGTPLLTEEPVADKIVVQRNGSFTDGRLYYFPSADGNPNNGQCLNIEASGAPTAQSACLAYVAEAREELDMSDKIVMKDLIPAMRELQPAEAASGSRRAAPASPRPASADLDEPADEPRP